MSKKTNKSKETKKKRKIWKKVLIVIVLILLGASGVFAYKVHINGGGTKGILSTVLDTKKDVGEFRCLVLGISTDEKGSLLTDTIMIASYNPQTQKAALVSVPRDTYTGKNTAKATAYEKINALYSRKEDPQTVLDAVNNLTGLDLQYYVIVKTEAFIKLVDAIGEVTFNVPIDMNYDDTSQDLHIHLKAGEQKLDGDKAEQLVRFRHNNNGTSYPDEYGNNDLGRMRTQREFITEVAKQTLQLKNITKIGSFVDIIKQNVTTNIKNWSTITDYVGYAVDFNTENINTASLPGEAGYYNKLSFFICDQKETNKLVTELFDEQNGVEEEISENTTNSSNTTNNTTTNSATTNKAADSTETTDNSKIKIELLNGSGDKTLLNKATKALKAEGYNVYKTGTTTTTSKTTIVNKTAVKNSIVDDIKDVLGVGNISSSVSSSSTVDIRIIIGKDYK